MIEKLTASDLVAILGAPPHLWTLKDGVLYCLGIQPQAFAWDTDTDGNDEPVRIYATCVKAIKSFGIPSNDYRGSLQSTESPQFVSIDHVVRRYDLIEFFILNWPALASTVKEAKAIVKGEKKVRLKKEDALHYLRSLIKMSKDSMHSLDDRGGWSMQATAEYAAKSGKKSSSTYYMIAKTLRVNTLQWIIQHEPDILADKFTDNFPTVDFT